nr:putative reverse transcriptase domain-containing protein [Tanacetum cinerariifolium]
MEFQVGDRFMLKVSPWKGVVRFGKREKLNPRYVGPFKVLEKVGSVAYKLELLQELSRIHNTFHVSNLKKCYADEPLAILLDGLHFDDKIYLWKTVEIMDRKVKRLKRSHIPFVKVAFGRIRDAFSVIDLHYRFTHSRMEKSDILGTPMNDHQKLDVDLEGILIDETKYQSMTGSLMYLISSRRDIMFSTCTCARYQAKPTEKHLTVVKWIFRYLRDAIKMGHWYPKDTSFEMTAISDVDHAGCQDISKSTSGSVRFWEKSWSAGLQRCKSALPCQP